jgi:hypothetical protein
MQKNGLNNLKRNNMTAVEWLISAHFGSVEMCTPDFRNKIKQAIELEKQQIINAFETAFIEAYKNKIIGVATDNRGQYRRFNSAGQYYSETYKNETE